MNTCSDAASAQSDEKRSSRRTWPRSSPCGRFASSCRRVTPSSRLRKDGSRLRAEVSRLCERVRVFADDRCPLRARSLLAPASPERFPDRRGHLMRNLVDLVPGEVHDLEAGPAQRGVAPELGNCALRVRVLDRPIGLANRLVSPPQEVGPANHPSLLPADPDLEFRRGKPKIAECDPRD